MESSPSSRTVMIIEDDPELRGVVTTLLANEGYTVEQEADGRAAVERVFLLKPDLILVDLRLPGLDGAEVCKRIRAGRLNTPIIVISAAKEEFDKVLLLELGADDYVVKPFGARELLARIKAVLRRSTPDRTVKCFATVEVDTERRLVTNRGNEVALTPSEYNLLLYFLQNPDRVLTREMILEDVWGFASAPTTRTVDSHVVKLRQKLEPEPSVPRYFLTVHGVGYRFVA
ncbi:MAG TPA: response regulator transcription factor [Bryobacteraceae bacterium]|nr:response regulator transcription factor [Bryobacteraceae bacterium]